MNRLEGKVAVITGANSGIGELTAELFAKEGAFVILMARRKEKLKEVEERINKNGGQALAISGDVSSVNDCKYVFEQVVKNFGKVDILVNNAGISDHFYSTLRTTDETWQNILAINLTGVFYCCREALKYMTLSNEGVIVNISSIGGVYGIAGAAYSSSKSAVIGLTKNIAVQYAGTKIRCNAVCPGPTDTPMQSPDPEGSFDAEMREITSRHMDISIGGTESVDQANAILFFANEESRYITGQCLIIDRGCCL